MFNASVHAFMHMQYMYVLHNFTQPKNFPALDREPSGSPDHWERINKDYFWFILRQWLVRYPAVCGCATAFRLGGKHSLTSSATSAPQ